jgi:hypothetical protein
VDLHHLPFAGFYRRFRRDPDQGFLTDQTWQIMGTADFNADGKADILWRNLSSGEIRIWYMNGQQITADVLVTTLASRTGRSWELATSMVTVKLTYSGATDLPAISASGV